MPSAASSAEKDEWTPVIAEVVATPAPVVAADGRKHLAYELLLTNHSTSAVKVRNISTLAGNGTRLGTIGGVRLAKMMKPLGAVTTGSTLGPGQAGYVLMDVTFRRKVRIPGGISHRISIALDPPNPTVATTYRSGQTPVKGGQGVIIAPPLRGNGWIVGNGCCSEFTSHRAAALAVNGGLYTSERYAIDFMQVQPKGNLLTGPWSELSSYPFFGTPVHSATPGRVVKVLDGLPETKPGPVPPVTAEKAGGNFVVVKFGRNRFAFYAHFQPGSITVKRGDLVRTGKVLGRLGSSGNSNAPHLHFHVMDGALPLASNGIPWRFDRFTVKGTLTNFPDLFEGETAEIEPAMKGLHRAQLPVNLQVIGFGKR